MIEMNKDWASASLSELGKAKAPSLFDLDGERYFILRQVGAWFGYYNGGYGLTDYVLKRVPDSGECVVKRVLSSSPEGIKLRELINSGLGVLEGDDYRNDRLLGEGNVFYLCKAKDLLSVLPLRTQKVKPAMRRALETEIATIPETAIAKLEPKSQTVLQEAVKSEDIPLKGLEEPLKDDVQNYWLHADEEKDVLRVQGRVVEDDAVHVARKGVSSILRKKGRTWPLGHVIDGHSELVVSREGCFASSGRTSERVMVKGKLQGWPAREEMRLYVLKGVSFVRVSALGSLMSQDIISMVNYQDEGENFRLVSCDAFMGWLDVPASKKVLLVRMGHVRSLLQEIEELSHEAREAILDMLEKLDVVDLSLPPSPEPEQEPVQPSPQVSQMELPMMEAPSRHKSMPVRCQDEQHMRLMLDYITEAMAHNLIEPSVGMQRKLDVINEWYDTNWNPMAKPSQVSPEVDLKDPYESALTLLTLEGASHSPTEIADVCGVSVSSVGLAVTRAGVRGNSAHSVAVMVDKSNGSGRVKAYRYNAGGVKLILPHLRSLIEEKNK